MILPVVIYPHPSLLNKAAPVTGITDEIHSIIKDMYETMYHDDGCGLAATQVNIRKRILVLDVSRDSDQPQCLINPEIISEEGEQTGSEGCLSFPELYLDITRPQKIVLHAINEFEQPVEIEAEGLLARCIHHEMDHLNGKTFIDRLSSPLKRERALKKLQKTLRELKRKSDGG